MDEFGLTEFIELTGIGVSSYGIYRLSATGVSIDPEAKLVDFSAVDQLEILRANRHLSLRFRCTPAEFMRWYDATRGTNGVSDFLLAKGFAEELRRHEEPSSHGVQPSVPSSEIVAAFRVKPVVGENARWWDLRQRNPGRYRLTSARALRGAAKRPSRWYPVLVAAWLIDEEHLTREATLGAMQKSFADCDLDLL